MGTPMDRSGRFFCTPVDSFEKAFPELESALIEYYETGDGVFALGPGHDPNSYSKPRQVREPLMRCSNPQCRRGGYEIDREISMMISERKEFEEFTMHCPGDEGSPKGRRPGKRCWNVLHVRLTLKYLSSPGAS